MVCSNEMCDLEDETFCILVGIATLTHPLTCRNKLHNSQRVIKQVCLLRRRVQGVSFILTCTPSHKTCTYLLQSLSKWAELLQLVLGIGVIIIIISRNSFSYSAPLALAHCHLVVVCGGLLDEGS